MLVKPEVARAQLEAERATLPDEERPGSGAAPVAAGGSTPGPGTDPGETTVLGFGPRPPTRFHGTVTLDTTRVGRDASRIATR